jgi:hypothetical protein
LELGATRPPIKQGQDGLGRKGPAPASASYYYSIPHLSVSGTVTRGGSQSLVVGTAWMDHEWSSQYLEQDATGWDWIGINLADGGALMAFRMRDRQGGHFWAGGALRHRNGRLKVFSPEEVQTTPMLVIAVLGLVANLLAAKGLHGHAHNDLNVKSAFLHVLGDAANGILDCGAPWFDHGSFVSLLLGNDSALAENVPEHRGLRSLELRLCKPNLSFTLLIERGCFCLCIRIYIDDRVEPRTSPIVSGNPRKIEFDELFRRQGSGNHRLLYFRNRCLLETESLFRG